MEQEKERDALHQVLACLAREDRSPDEDLDRRPAERVRDPATRLLPATTGIHCENDREVYPQPVDLARQHAHDLGMSWPSIGAERCDRRQALCGGTLVGYTGDRHGGNNRLSA